MFFYFCEKNPFFQFALKFEEHDLDHTHIEVSMDGLAYRFPKMYLQEWLGFNSIEWLWECKKTEVWQGEPHAFAMDPSKKPPIIKFSNADDAAFFKLTWDLR